MRHPHSLHALLICGLAGVVAGDAWAQRGATGPVADLNAQARSVSETDPDRSLALARQALAAAAAAEDVRGEAEAHNYIAYGYRNHSFLDLARQSAEQSLRLYVEAGDQRGEMATELNLGDVYRGMNDLPRATAAFNRALALG